MNNTSGDLAADLERVVSALGEHNYLDGAPSAQGEQRMFCPICEDPDESHSPSASLNVESGLFSCQKSSNEHSGALVRLVQHLSSRGIDVGTLSPVTRRRTEPKAKTLPKAVGPEIERRLEKAELRFEVEEDSPAARDHLRFLQKERGLTEETIRKWRLGVEYSERDEEWRIWIPVVIDGQIVNVRKYKMDAAAGDKMRSVPGHGSGALLLGADLLAEYPDLPVLMCESELDCILANQEAVQPDGSRLYVAVTGTGGASNVPANIDLLRGRDVCIAYDADHAGREGARKVAVALAKIDTAARVLDLTTLGLQPDSGEDITDLLMQHQEAVDLAAAMARTESMEPAAAAEQEHAAQVEEHAERLRVQRDARALVDSETAKTTFTGFGSVSLREALEKPREVKPAIIKSLQMQGHKATLTAQFKAGKTTLAGNLVRSLADGEPFLDRFPVFELPGNIGIFDYELTEDDALDMYGALGLRNTNRVFLESLRREGFSLANESHRDQAVKWLREHDIVYWVIDPFGRALRGFGSENANDDVRVFLDTLDEVVERAGLLGTLMPVHTGRMQHDVGAEHGRGATVVDDDADARWLLTRDPSGRRFFRAEGRSGVGVDEVSLEFDTATARLSTGTITRAQSKGERLLPEVENFLADHPGAGTNDIRKEVDGGNSQIDAAIKLGIANGSIRVEQSGQKKSHFLVPSQKLTISKEGEK